MNFGNKCSCPHRNVEEQPKKKPKNDGDKNAVAILTRCATVELRIAGHRAAGILSDFTEEHRHAETDPDVYGSVRRVRFTRTALRRRTSEKTKIHR